MDAFAVAIASGVKMGAVHKRQFARLSLSFGLFQFMMPVIGWFLGLTVRSFIENWDHWVAFGLLAFIGVNMLRESCGKGTGEKERSGSDPTVGWSLLVLSVATSIDALAVGLSFAVLNRVIWAPAVLIGVTCAILTCLGLYLGKALSRAEIVGKRAELIGGLVLIGIGITILIEHGVFG